MAIYAGRFKYRVVYCPATPVARNPTVFGDNDAYVCRAKCSELNAQLFEANPVSPTNGPVDYCFVQAASGRPLPWSPAEKRGPKKGKDKRPDRRRGRPGKLKAKKKLCSKERV